MKIVDYTLHRVHLPLPQPIGDSQVRFDEHWMTVLELTTDDGLTGVGFELQQGLPTPALAQLRQQYEWQVWPQVKGSHPGSESLRISRPRGGNVGAATFPLATETAVWDLLAKSLDLPLYKLLGGTASKIPAYGSTLDFQLGDEDFRSKLSRFRELGFRSMKIKVGHPDVAWDLRRMSIAKEVMAGEGDLMVDANEAWSPKETLRRMSIYEREGFDIFWIEDPITREDYAGYGRLSAELSSSRINTGEYLGFSGKRRLLESGGVDVLNIHGSLGMSRAAAHLAGDFGIPVSLGNTIGEIGVHLAVSLPECLYLEFSNLEWNRLFQEPVQFADGFAIAPDRPGHGLELDRDALEQFSRPD
jgi:L-alanine-DL-glutamate epimerase-like enolase superfamily enzyme